MAVFIAFYSYRGGVGRSLALANVGWALASRGKRVALVDMDLEAPGLHTFAELAQPSEAAPRGLVEYATAYAATGECPAIREHAYEVPVASNGHGRLWVIPAGNDRAGYQGWLADLDWRRLHPHKGSVPFVEGFRAAVERELDPEYVLVDARTGFSDVGGLTTHVLADQVVLVFNLTRACIDGTVQAYESMIARPKPPRVVLVASPVPRVAPSVGTLARQRIDDASRRMPHGRDGRGVIDIEYDADMVLAEELAVTAADRYPAAQRYELLTRALREANPHEVFLAEQSARRLLDEGRAPDAIKELADFVRQHPGDAEAHAAHGRVLLLTERLADAETALRTSVSLRGDDPESLRALGEALLRQGKADGALEHLRKAEQAGDRSVPLYRAMSQAAGATGNRETEQEARRKGILAVIGPERPEQEGGEVDVATLREAVLDYLTRFPPAPGFVAETFWKQVAGSLALTRWQKLTILKQAVEGSLARAQIRELTRILEEEPATWSGVLGESAARLMDRVAEVLASNTSESIAGLARGDELDATILAFAGSRATPSDPGLLERATRLSGAPPVAYLWHADALLNAARVQEGEHAATLRRQACELYATAVRLAPHMHDALYNWGITLNDLAREHEGAERVALFREACERYAEAVRIKPDKHEALNNWGNSLDGLAREHDGAERVALFREACERYAEAVRVKPDKHEALYNWGNSLARLAREHEGAERVALLREACEQYAEAVRIKPDKHEALNNWGNSLDGLAREHEGAERVALFREACERYAEAVRVKPDRHEAHDGWASSLLWLTNLASDPTEARALAMQAAERARAASAAEAHSGDYNLACALVWLGEPDEAAALLHADLGRRPHIRNHALKDADLAPLWAARPELRRLVVQEQVSSGASPTGRAGPELELAGLPPQDPL